MRSGLFDGPLCWEPISALFYSLLSWYLSYPLHSHMAVSPLRFSDELILAPCQQMGPLGAFILSMRLWEQKYLKWSNESESDLGIKSGAQCLIHCHLVLTSPSFFYNFRVFLDVMLFFDAHVQLIFLKPSHIYNGVCVCMHEYALALTNHSYLSVNKLLKVSNFLFPS